MVDFFNRFRRVLKRKLNRYSEPKTFDEDGPRFQSLLRMGFSSKWLAPAGSFFAMDAKIQQLVDVAEK